MTVEELLKAQIGDLVFRIAILTVELEKVNKKLEELNGNKANS